MVRHWICHRSCMNIMNRFMDSWNPHWSNITNLPWQHLSSRAVPLRLEPGSRIWRITVQKVGLFAAMAKFTMVDWKGLKEWHQNVFLCKKRKMYKNAIMRLSNLVNPSCDLWYPEGWLDMLENGTRHYFNPRNRCGLKWMYHMTLRSNKGQSQELIGSWSSTKKKKLWWYPQQQ